jgi:membrane protein implicated in regulation of membrane protease activity
METALQVLLDIGPYHWLALAALLVAIEMVMPTQYLIWPAVAAAAIGLLSFLVDLPLVGEIAVFAVLSAGLTMLADRLFPSAVADEKRMLNQRGDQMVGQLAVVADDFAGGAGGVVFGDTRWAARSADGSDLAAATRVVIVQAEGTLLVVRPATSPMR